MGLSNFSREADNWKGDGRQGGVTHATIVDHVPGIIQELADESQEVVPTGQVAVDEPAVLAEPWWQSGSQREDFV